MGYPDATQGTTHFNAVAAAAVDVGTITGGKNWAGSTITGSTATIKVIAGSNLSGSTFALPTGGGLGGMAVVVNGTTGAAGATVSSTHSLAATPAFVALTNEGTSGGVQLMAKGTGEILVQANIGTVAYSAMLFK